MVNRRLEPRMLCADMVDVRWEDPKTGRTRRVVANLDDISRCGACLIVARIIPAKTPLRIIYPGGELRGKVAYSAWQELGYFIGVEFDPDCRWSEENYRPQHLYDPSHE